MINDRLYLRGQTGDEIHKMIIAEDDLAQIKFQVQLIHEQNHDNINKIDKI